MTFQRIPISALLYAMLFAVFSASAQGGAYDALLDRIEKAIADKDWQSAELSITEALRSDPSNPSNPLLMSNLGMIQFYNGQDSLAIETLSAANAMAPSSVTILANRARVYTASGHTPEAVADYNRIELLDPDYSDTYLYRGLIYLYSGNFEDAESDLSKLHSLSPNDEGTLIAMASLYTITSRHKEAVPFYNLLIKKDQQAEYYAGRAMCLLNLDDLTGAAEDIASGLELDDSYSELYLCRAILNKKRYESDASLVDATRAIDLGANPQRVKSLLAL